MANQLGLDLPNVRDDKSTDLLMHKAKDDLAYEPKEWNGKSNTDVAQTETGEGGKEKRETWGHKAEFILATIGLGIVWGFLYLCQKNGGGNTSEEQDKNNTWKGSGEVHNLLNREGLVCVCQTSTQKASKLLESLLTGSHESTLQAVCEMLDTVVPLCGNYTDVARHFKFNRFQISSGLGQATYPGEPTRTRALIMSLASSHPDLTVEEFATVVEKKAKRKDVSRLLRAYDKAEEATEEL